MNRSLLARAFVLSAVFLFVSVGFEHRPTISEEPTEPPEADREKALLQAATRHMRHLDLRRIDGNGNIIELIDHALLSFGDPARMHQRGSFWAWQPTGRPAAFLELWQNTDQPELWRHSIALSSSERLSLDALIAGRWTPPETPLETPGIANGPAPAKEVAARLRQIRDLAKRFTAHEFWDPDNSRFELHLLPQPRLNRIAVYDIEHGQWLGQSRDTGRVPVTRRWHRPTIEPVQI